MMAAARGKVDVPIDAELFVRCLRMLARLSVAGNHEFIMKTRNAPDQIRLQPGQEIEIGWLPEDCRALDAA